MLDFGWPNMTGLVLKLGPKERVLINGAIIENGDRRNRLNIVTPNTKILRLRDAIQPRDATTPVRQICLTVQMVLTGDAAPDAARRQILLRLEELGHSLTDSDSQKHLASATEALLGNQFYHCLKALRALIPSEDRGLAAR